MDVSGMNSGLNPADPIIVAAFRSALLNQFAIVCGIFLVLLAAWAALRGRAGLDAATGRGSPAAARGGAGQRAAWPEPRARRLLRIGFGALWLFDGILQAQPQMPGGLPSQVIAPAASTSPQWVQHLVNWGGSIWAYHPVQAAASVVWIQVGIGLWLICAPRGWPSRLAGLAAAGWGLAVWVFGEAFGSVFGTGLTVLSGAPGSALIYVIAGIAVFLPERSLATARAGRAVLALTGAFFLAMAALQAWPGRGFWHGTLHGTLAVMLRSMAATPQPRPLARLIAAFASFTAAHGWGVNLFAVLALAVLGAGFCASAALPAGARLRRTRLDGVALARITTAAAAVACLADWVLIQDFGFFGGVGTDPNSMIPLVLVFTAGCLALAQSPAPAPAAVTADAPDTGTADAPDAGAGPDAGAAGGQGRARNRVPAAAVLRARIAAASGQTVLAAGALGIVLVGAAPMASASVSRNADPIIAQAIAGQSAPIAIPEHDFTLTSQAGRQVSLASLRGKAVLLTFLDPVCTSDCPVIAAEMRAADTLLGPLARKTELVAVVANPTYRSLAFTQAFTRQEGLGGVPNWLYLTGSLPSLERVWNAYGVQVDDLPAGAMTAHADLAYVIGPSGLIREELSDDPGPGTPSTRSSFAVLMADAVTQSLNGAG
jgi:cytochrome oxidase Cu insertion factor (SCO1/SenC/PrrC family)